MRSLRTTDMARDYCHKVIDHARAYAEAAVHTNGLENSGRC